MISTRPCPVSTLVIFPFLRHPRLIVPEGFFPQIWPFFACRSLSNKTSPERLSLTSSYQMVLFHYFQSPYDSAVCTSVGKMIMVLPAHGCEMKSDCMSACAHLIHNEYHADVHYLKLSYSSAYFFSFSLSSLEHRLPGDRNFVFLVLRMFPVGNCLSQARIWDMTSMHSILFLLLLLIFWSVNERGKSFNFCVASL